MISLEKNRIKLLEVIIFSILRIIAMILILLYHLVEESPNLLVTQTANV